MFNAIYIFLIPYVYEVYYQEDSNLQNSQTAETGIDTDDKPTIDTVTDVPKNGREFGAWETLTNLHHLTQRISQETSVTGV